MNRRILLQVTAPSVVVGLLLLAACLVSAWHVNRAQSVMTDILAQNVASVEAAQELEINARELRFDCFLYLVAPAPDLLDEIARDREQFERSLRRVEQLGYTAGEKAHVEAIKEGYARYRREFDRLRAEPVGPRRDVRALAEGGSLSLVVEPCREYLRLNEEMMERSSEENGRVSRRLRLTLVLLGLGGPLAGLVSGYGMARGLSRSLYQLSVRVQDAAQRLEEDVAAVRLTPDGDLRHLDEQVRHVVARVAEVAGRLQRQQADMLRAQQLAAVGQLAASVAHEVRNPLTSIKLLVEAALRENRPRPFTADNLRVVHGEILRLEQTVQSFLEFARPPALRRRAGDLRGVVQQAVELVRARSRQQRVEIDARCPPEPVVADADHGQLTTVLVNLCVNALDAMPAGGRLGVHLEAGPGAARLRVTDTGAGVAPEMEGRLFTPFASTKPTGSGLGLSICRRIAEEHGGRIDAANPPGGGASFTVTLPLANGDSHADSPGR